MWTWTIGSGVCATSRGTVSRCGVHQLSESTSSSYGSHMLRSNSTTQGVIALISGESEFYASVKGTSAGLGAVSMLKNLGVDNCKKTKIDKAVLEVRVDASAARGIAVRRRAGRIRHGTQAHARRHSQNHENPWSLEPGRSWNQTPGRRVNSTNIGEMSLLHW